MSEILKYNGNVKKAIEETQIPDWQEITDELLDKGEEEDNDVIKYKLN
jgi:hypothetical protein